MGESPYSPKDLFGHLIGRQLRAANIWIGFSTSQLTYKTAIGPADSPTIASASPTSNAAKA
jgi:hypothetical protein